jgi:hypothetical protein
MDISGSALDYAIVGYYVECFPASDLDRKIEDILLITNAVDREWRPTLTHCIDARNRLLSQLQPLMHAKKAIGADIDWLSDGRCYSANVGPADNYFVMKFRAH